MEEDIKILEEMCNEIINEDSCNLFETLSPYEIALKIENLIKGYKDGEDILKNITKENLELKEYIRELEEENATLKKANNIAENVKVDDLTQAMYKSYEDFMKKYIPKSKVKELHKEYYEKAFAEPYDCTTADYKHSQAMGGWRALNKLLMEDK